ncbi:NAD(P)-dependent dehydrogenase [Commensalibacter communis]|uniref:SDR family oxidoreductase n=1 Tax=Commensalibacter communis TaxID=2972786 RepID=UPI0022FFBCC7|nr:SDR family oxidoreductase [Commensalibacter communis]CAI3948613.1 NAD(P)-dependent dehydrogenase [Commensalibacter communis]
MSHQDIYKMQDPTTEFYHDKFSKQSQPAPAIQSKMQPIPDCGETSYKGSNKLAGRNALVTGGDSGIGRAAAIAYAREGADVAINYLPAEQSDAEEVANIIKSEGRNAVLIPGDLSDEGFNKQMVDEAYQKLGGLDILALVAGKQQATDGILNISTEQMRKTYEINVFSLFWTIKAALSYLPKGASIITTSSIQGYQPSAILIDYASTKGAITTFSKALAKELAPKGIRVNIVAPGPIWTPLQVCGGQLQEDLPEFGTDTPLGRAGQPVELSSLYVFLASQESSYVTAEVFGVTGGNHCP